jgi:hypothetical protein
MVRPVGGNAYSQPSGIQTQSTIATNNKSATQDPAQQSQAPLGSFAKTPQQLREKAELEAEGKKRSDDLNKELRDRYADKTPKKSQEVKLNNRRTFN